DLASIGRSLEQNIRWNSTTYSPWSRYHHLSLPERKPPSRCHPEATQVPLFARRPDPGASSIPHCHRRRLPQREIDTLHWRIDTLPARLQHPSCWYAVI